MGLDQHWNCSCVNSHSSKHGMPWWQCNATYNTCHSVDLEISRRIVTADGEAHDITRCARALRKRRVDAGALTLASPEVRFELDASTQDPLDVAMYVTREANQARSMHTFFTHHSVSTFDRVPFQPTGEMCLYGTPLIRWWRR